METETFREKLRQRSARRLRHEAQIRVFKAQKGDLEKIRKELGLRPSQICEILKVHPSAWTRWIKTENAPPHIYQMVEWYMELLQWRGQKHPLMERPHEQGRVLVQQDPQTYVTPTLNHDFVEQASSNPKPSLKIQKILILVWCIQTVLWCIVLAVLVKNR